LHHGKEDIFVERCRGEGMSIIEVGGSRKGESRVGSHKDNETQSHTNGSVPRSVYEMRRHAYRTSVTMRRGEDVLLTSMTFLIHYAKYRCVRDDVVRVRL